MQWVKAYYPQHPGEIMQVCCVKTISKYNNVNAEEEDLQLATLRIKI